MEILIMKQDILGNSYYMFSCTNIVVSYSYMSNYMRVNDDLFELINWDSGANYNYICIK